MNHQAIRETCISIYINRMSLTKWALKSYKIKTVSWRIRGHQQRIISKYAKLNTATRRRKTTSSTQWVELWTNKSRRLAAATTPMVSLQEWVWIRCKASRVAWVCSRTSTTWKRWWASSRRHSSSSQMPWVCTTWWLLEWFRCHQVWCIKTN